MASPIDPISNLSGLGSIQRLERIQREDASKVQKSTEQPDFAKILNQAMEQVNKDQKVAEAAADDFAAGKLSSIHDVMVSAEKAAMSLRLTLEVRNKIVSAYQEIMRMQL
ncbi:MAG TPA: flagellar hook-basal body complex protein FliE [Thermotogota bacterium]|nr:flagellar hook-basal body complex protein FliE [Thermotogota bacterium]HRW92904.1 flagellar hook-basal body complex protein FliE [Thermotogota bacterium]